MTSQEAVGVSPAKDTGTVTRQQWKWSVLAGMASYLDAGSIEPVAALLSLCLLISGVVGYFFMPDTTGKSLEQIQTERTAA